MHPAQSGPGTALSWRAAPDSADAVHVRGRDGRLRTLTRGELAQRVASAAGILAGERRLVHVHGANDLDTLVGYLAAHEAGHDVLLTPPGSPALALAAAWDPDITVSSTGGGTPAIQHHRENAAHHLHPDLALLMSTSGSRGSPRPACGLTSSAP